MSKKTKRKPLEEEEIRANLSSLDPPSAYRATLERAYRENSPAAAIKAKCLDCTLFQREEIRLCSVKTCPLWRFRPYQ